MVKYPVCGMDVNEKEARVSPTHMGQAFYFCSEHCEKAFDASPSRYVE